MSKDSVFRFKVGDFDCRVVSDGEITVPDMVTPKPYNPADPTSGLPMDVNCLIIMSPDHRILIDTGCGPSFGPKSGKLLENMKSAGVRPSGIDIVIISHAHGDHIGANFDASGTPVFPNATFVMHRKEWEHWMGRLEATKADPKSMMNITRQNLPPLRDRLRLVEDKETIIPGIDCILTPGHTPGGLMFVLHSGNDRLCCIGDLVHHTLELNKPDVFAIFDVDKDEAVDVRKRTLPGFAESGVLVFSCHFDFPGLGHVVRKGSQLAWEPIRT